MTDRQRAFELLSELDDITCIDYESAFKNIIGNFMSGSDALEAIQFIVEEEGYEDLLE